ncbi:MAG TPA: glycosyltransferase family 4 protein [Polyangiaceae bacterium]|nr:glycosyltransferase family 4 protein [Polyangiaceae bacterium]
MKLVYIATDPITAFRLMDGQLGYMRSRGFEVTVITAPGPLLQRAAEREGVRAIAVPMTREMSPLADVATLWRLIRVLKKLEPDIVNAGTPKAGLLGVLAAQFCRVKVVVYLLRGLRFEGARGAKRLLLAATEHVAGGVADRVFVNSDSLRDRFVALGCAPAAKAWVPAHGSSNGIELERFAPNPEKLAHAAGERRRLELPDDALVVGFVGRFTRDKGLVELLRAFQQAALSEPRLRLLLIGDHDETDPLPLETRRAITEDPRIICTGFVDEPAAYYPLMSLFVFPSYREGFPNAPLEAAAAGLPIVGFRATGTVDAIVDGETGVLVDRDDAAGFTRAILRYAGSAELRQMHGAAGQQRVARLFRREVLWAALEAEYRRMALAAGVG